MGMIIMGWQNRLHPPRRTVSPNSSSLRSFPRSSPQVSIPLIAVNRINKPDVAESVLADNCADMVSLARPLLADPGMHPVAQRFIVRGMLAVHFGSRVYEL